MLDAAAVVFAERGFQATTMEEVAERVGVTKPLIYEYFGSKEGIFTATLQRARGRLLAALVRAWDTEARTPIRDRFRLVVLAFFRFVDEHEGEFSLFRREGSVSGEASAEIERIRQQTAKAFVQGLQSVPDFAALPADRVTAMAEILVGGCERLAVWRAEHGGMDADAAAELVMVTIWDGLATLAQGS